MYCALCGHKNPPENKFCGMCGTELLAPPLRHAAPPQEAQPERAVSRNVPPFTPPATAQPKAVNEEEMRAEFADWDARRRAAEASERKPEASERKTDPGTAERAPMVVPSSDEGTEMEAREADPATEIHGPSFLGLSGSESSSSSYLLDDDQGGGSNTGRNLALLILLLAIAAVIWKWEPIKTYVWTEASKHALTAQPAVSTPPAADTAAANSESAIPQDDQTDFSAPGAAKPGNTASTPNTNAPLDSAAIDSETPANSAPAANPAPAADAKKDPNSTAAPQPSEEKAAASGEPQAISTASKPAASERAAESTAAKSPAEDASPSDRDAREEASARAPARTAAKPAPAAPKAEPGADLLARGEAFLYGRGVPQSCRQALVYFKAAADRDNPGAMSHVAAMYATGECGVRINRVQAYRWFSKAYELQPSNHYLEQNLTMLWRQMSDEERQAATHSGGQRGE